MRNTVLDFARTFGATGLLAGTIPPPGAMPQEQISNILLDAWPSEWSQRYFSQGYLHRDPTIHLVRVLGEPFEWREIGEHCRLSASGMKVMHEAADFRLKDGITFGFRSLERHPIGFSFAGERFELDPQQRQVVQLVAACAVGHLIGVSSGSSAKRTVSLSPRQYEVLQWAAAGMTIDETADRLSISVHTVDMHLRAIREKLGVGSTVHAVAEAFRLRLIS